MTTKTNKNLKKAVALGLCASLLASIGIGAYLTDTDTKSDVYTVGNVQAEIIANGDMEVANAGYLLPNTIHTYERAATNTGINDAYVFMSITIPYEFVGTADENGTQGDPGSMQLFIPGSADGGYINSEWKLVDAGFIGSKEIVANGQAHGEHDTHSVTSISDITYVYGYIGDNADGALKALASGETTSNLVDTMQLINLFTVGKNTGEVSTKLYAIQSNHVNGGLTDVNGVWAVINTALNGEADGSHLVIEDGTTTISMGAYAMNEEITSVYIPASVETIEAGAFCAMPNLTAVTFADGSKLKTIGDSAFAANPNLTSFEIPSSVETIGPAAFAQSGITNIIIPSSVTSMNNNTFEYSSALKSVVIEANITEIPMSTFSNCTGLETVTLPASVNAIALQAFDGCTSLKTINYGGDLNQWNAITFGNNWNRNVPADCQIITNGEYSGDIPGEEIPEIEFVDEDVYFSNLTSTNDRAGTAQISPIDNDIVMISVNRLMHKDDKVQYTLEIKNDGVVDVAAYLELIADNEDDFSVSIDQSEINIASEETTTVTVTIQLLRNSADTLECNIEIRLVEDDM